MPAHHPQIRQGKQSGQLRRVLGQATEASFHIAELTLDHTKCMFDFRSRLRFDLLDLASGFVEHAAFAQVLVGARTSRNLPYHRPSFMLRPLIQAGITRVGTDNIFIAMQQVSDLRYIGHICRCAVGVVHQTRLGICTDMRLHAEEMLVTFLRLMHFGIAFTFLVLGRTGCVDNGRVDKGALAQRQAFVSQVIVDGFQNARRQLMLLQKVSEIHDRRVFGGAAR